jgi:hypothetical protein
LKDGWLKLPDDEKDVYRKWTEWDKLRYARDLAIYEKVKSDEHDDTADEIENDDMKAIHVPKKRKQVPAEDNSIVPRKRK